MGCGKSKHDVASGNTVLQRKKSAVDSGQENGGTETKGINNNNIDNESSKVLEQKNDIENVKKIDEKIVQQEKVLEKSRLEADAVENKTQEIIAAEGTSEKSEDGKEDSLKQEVNDAAEEEKAENEKEGDNLVNKKETKDINIQEVNLVEEGETKETTQEETSAKEETNKETTQEEELEKEEETNDTNVISTSEGEQKDLKADEQGQ